MSAIPLDLRERSQWVLWRYALRDGKWTKVPVCPFGRKPMAASDDPSTWAAFDEAWASYQAGGFDGIGFVFAAEDPFFGVDFDDCLADGEVAEWSRPLIAKIEGTYGEISPSGTGVKFIARGKLPADTGTKRKPMAPDGSGAIELYDHKRFFTLTGNAWDETGPGIADRQRAADDLYAIAKERPAKPAKPAKVRPSGNGHAAGSSNGVHDDDEVVRVAGYSRDFGRLWQGNGSGFPSDSEADMALCNRLAFYCGPAREDQVSRLFLRSGRGGREKVKDRDDYLARTIAKAYEGRVEYFDWRPPGVRIRAVPSSNGDGHHDTNGQAEVAPKPARAPRTDTGNAERMVARFGDRIRHCHPWKKWLCHDGRRWVLDDTPSIHQLAKKTARHILAEAAAIEDKARRTACVKWARESESRSRLNSMIALAAVEEGIPIRPDVLDADPWLLNVENGTIDLRAGELRAHRREDFITRLAPVAFDPAAACPLWDSVLFKIFGGNLDLIAFWDRLCGLALTGVAYEQILPILWGKGSNGKTTIVKTLVNLMGPDFAMIAPPGLLVAKRGEAHPTERAILHGKRLVVEMETEEGVRLNENLIKHLTGGDSITARRMGEDFWSFDPTHKLMLCTNHKPEVKGTDHAIWRRPKLVPFTVTIPDSEAITDLAERLRAEYSGILARCVRGCLDWQRDGLRVPAEVTEATEGYRAEQDTLRAFLDEECVTGAQIRVKATPLYAKYRSVTEGRGETPMSQKSFGIAVVDRGFERFTNNGTWYRGLGLRSDGPGDTDSPY